MLFGDDRNQMRRYFRTVWQKYICGQPLEPVERIIADVIHQHPEYHALLTGPDAQLERDFFPELGEINPFLHLGMHIAIQEQLRSNRPAGIVDLYGRLVQRAGDAHEAEHQLQDCLGRVLWEAQCAGTMPDEGRYLELLQALLQQH
jgi:hypothetical protein